MKTLLIISLSCFLSYQVSAQNKLYVKQDGGATSILNFGKVGFDEYYFSNQSEKCDTLICAGAGLINCDIDNSFGALNEEQKETYQIYNKAIQKSIREIKKAGKPSGEISLTLKGKTVNVKYFEFTSAGNLEMEITVI